MNGVRFRLYVAGKLTDEQWADSDPDEVKCLCEAQADACSELDRPWMAEISHMGCDCAGNGPGHRGGYLRFGTDETMMADPIPYLGGVWIDMDTGVLRQSSK